MTQQNPFSQVLLHWYDKHKRDLPWRSPDATPYSIWLSEIMLQQTTVPTVKAYYKRFLEKWSTVEALANASLQDVLVQWQGLGYYSRARNLHACAQLVVLDYEGRFPSSYEGLLALPGIGPYTAAAIASIAFQKPNAVVDGNVVRVLSRLKTIETPYPASKPEIQKVAQELTPMNRPGDYAQALMDLGAMICKPKSPQCNICPVRDYCEAKDLTPERYPIRVQKKTKPTLHTIAFLIKNPNGEIYLQKRPNNGLLGGMMEVPSLPWCETLSESISNKNPILSLKNNKPISLGEVKHTFTHFHLIAKVQSMCVETFSENGIWVKPKDLHNHPLPTLMKKIINKGLS